MKKGKEIKLLDKKWNKVISWLTKFTNSQNQDDLHQLRIRIKKLKSLLILFDSHTKHTKISRHFKPVKQIFKCAGIIREAYIHLQLADRYKVKQPEFRKEQQEIIKEETESFLKYESIYLKKIDKAQKNIKKDLHGIEDDHITAFFTNQFDQIVLTLVKRDFNGVEVMHTCRKHIKNLLYNQKIAETHLKKETRLNTTYLGKVQDSIGHWHDKHLAIKVFWSQGPDNGPTFKKLKQQIEKDEKTIISLSADFWQKAIVNNN